MRTDNYKLGDIVEIIECGSLKNDESQIYYIGKHGKIIEMDIENYYLVEIDSEHKVRCVDYELKYHDYLTHIIELLDILQDKI